MDPFLKWAGGKRWLINNHSNIFPIDYNRYFEPFLGSGAVFFHLKPRKAILSDLNKELILTYKALKNNWRLVYKHLCEHHKNHSKEYYYKIRDYRAHGKYAEAARFIYLNRTCWNGLYRVNLKGKFNVPIGTKQKVILTKDNFKIISELLKDVTLLYEDFEYVINKAQKDDLIFIDPPYTVSHNKNAFIKYNEKLFSWEDQLRLHKALEKARMKGVKVIATNAYHDSLIELYKTNFNIIPIERFSIIASKLSARKTYEELLILTF